MLKNMIVFVVGLFAVAFGVSYAHASESTVSIKQADVSTYTPQEDGLGKYYVLEWVLPEYLSGKRLEGAVVEFYVDVGSYTKGDFQWFDADSVEHVGYTSRTPLIEVYALKGPVLGAVQAGQLETSMAARQPVLVGNGRRVVMDITPIVVSYLENPTRNHGLIVGSLTGVREGDFVLKSGTLSDEAIAQIHLQYAPQTE